MNKPWNRSFKKYPTLLYYYVKIILLFMRQRTSIIFIFSSFLICMSELLVNFFDSFVFLRYETKVRIMKELRGGVTSNLESCFATPYFSPYPVGSYSYCRYIVGLVTTSNLLRKSIFNIFEIYQRQYNKKNYEWQSFVSVAYSRLHYGCFARQSTEAYYPSVLHAAQ